MWFKQDFQEEHLLQAKNKITSFAEKFTIPVWGKNLEDRSSLLEQQGFTQAFGQIGMHLKLEHAFEENNTVQLRLLEQHKGAELWSELFASAFGYLIHPDVIRKTMDPVQYFIAYHQNQPAGTGVLYQTGKVAGIHSIGVSPKMRRKGLAEQITIQLLNLAKDQKMEYATLQASDMGKGLYLKLGFEEDFTMSNYRLNK
ncbi:GNAT family N-acetyltransferase [Rapidithrix thailandica]|uniref:GNAT family N-acetyltransferase n=1 Tax=Rapidithrix thailandica TaxID=413964 RepID=A0AAW9SEK9_9BACT